MCPIRLICENFFLTQSFYDNIAYLSELRTINFIDLTKQSFYPCSLINGAAGLLCFS